MTVTFVDKRYIHNFEKFNFLSIFTCNRKGDCIFSSIYKIIESSTIFLIIFIILLHNEFHIMMNSYNAINKTFNYDFIYLKINVSKEKV